MLTSSRVYYQWIAKHYDSAAVFCASLREAPLTVLPQDLGLN